MDNSLLVSLSRQVASYRAMDVIANNIANMSTPAFKRGAVQFHEILVQTADPAGSGGTGTMSFVQDAGVLRDTSEGPLTRTGAPFDIAISGQGYFQVQTPQGTRYTRDGHFSLSADGQIVNGAGYPLIGDGGPISITPDDGPIHIAADGTVSGKTGQLGSIKLVSFASESALTQEGAGLYSSSAPTQPSPGGVLQQGMLEGSNVQPVVEMSHMIEVMRNYQAVAALSQSQQQMLTQAIEKLGTIQS